MFHQICSVVTFSCGSSVLVIWVTPLTWLVTSSGRAFRQLDVVFYNSVTVLSTVVALAGVAAPLDFPVGLFNDNGLSTP